MSMPSDVSSAVTGTITKVAENFKEKLIGIHFLASYVPSELRTVID